MAHSTMVLLEIEPCDHPSVASNYPCPQQWRRVQALAARNALARPSYWRSADPWAIRLLRPLRVPLAEKQFLISRDSRTRVNSASTPVAAAADVPGRSYGGMGVGFSPTEVRSVMRTTKQLSITLPNDMAEALKERVAAGEYASESEVIRDGLRVLFARDEAVDEWLRREVVTAYDELRAEPSRAIDAQEMRNHLADLHAQRRAASDS